MTAEDHKPFNIVVNGRPRSVTQKELTYLEVVQLAFPGQVPSDTQSFTVNFFKGPDGKHQGSLVAGESVKSKDGMVFDVTATNRS